MERAAAKKIVNVRSLRMTNKATYNAYEIKTVRDILNIPTERFEAFLSEMPDQMRYLKQLWDAANILSEGSTVPVELMKVVWVDDGETTATTTLHGIDPDANVEAMTLTIKK